MSPLSSKIGDIYQQGHHRKQNNFEKSSFARLILWSSKKTWKDWRKSFAEKSLRQSFYERTDFGLFVLVSFFLTPTRALNLTANPAASPDHYYSINATKNNLTQLWQLNATHATQRNSSYSFNSQFSLVKATCVPWSHCLLQEFLGFC